MLLPLLGDPKLDSLLLLIITVAELFVLWIEWSARKTIRASHQVEKATYELYKTYFEVTEKRKADARDKAAATRAAKRTALASGTIPPLVMEEEEPTSPPES